MVSTEANGFGWQIQNKYLHFGITNTRSNQKYPNPMFAVPLHL